MQALIFGRVQYFCLRYSAKNMSNWLQAGKMYQNYSTNFIAFAEGISRKAIFLKNETSKTLLRTVKTSILEPEKTTALSDEACLPRLCFERNFMMEDTL